VPVLQAIGVVIAALVIVGMALAGRHGAAHRGAHAAIGRRLRRTAWSALVVVAPVHPLRRAWFLLFPGSVLTAGLAGGSLG